MSRIEWDCALGQVASSDNLPSRVRMGFDLEVRRSEPQSDNEPLTPHLGGVSDVEK